MARFVHHELRLLNPAFSSPLLDVLTDLVLHTASSLQKPGAVFSLCAPANPQHPSVCALSQGIRRDGPLSTRPGSCGKGTKRWGAGDSLGRWEWQTKQLRFSRCFQAICRILHEVSAGGRLLNPAAHADSGTPLPEIMEFLGHKDIQTTMIHVETSMASKRRSQDALSLKLGLA